MPRHHESPAKTAPRADAEPTAHHRRPLARLAHRLSAARSDPAFARPRARDAVQLAATTDRRRALPGSVRGQRRARARGAVARRRARDFRRSRAAGRPSSDADAGTARQSRCAVRRRGRAAIPAAPAAAIRHRVPRSAVRLRRCWQAVVQPAAAGLAGARRAMFTWNVRPIARSPTLPAQLGAYSAPSSAGQVGYHLLRASDPAKEVSP